MLLTFNYKCWRICILDEDVDDIAYNWRTYIITNKRIFKLFNIAKELIEDHSYCKEFFLLIIRELEQNKEHKMTREEAIRKLGTLLADNNVPYLITQLEALGLLKFSEEKKQAPYPIIELSHNGDIINRLYDKGKHLLNKYGVIRLEEWPEGLVLWVDGLIVWKSWEKYYKKGDAVTIEYYHGNIGGKLNQAGIIA